MKHLKTLQVLSKLGKILSKIAFICSVVGGCACVSGLLAIAFGNDAVIKIGGVTLHGILEKSDYYNLKSMVAVLTAWLVICAGEAVLAKFAELYFKRVLAAGTPFTQKGAKELKRLGILTIAIPTGCAVFAQILLELIAKFTQAAGSGAEMQFDSSASCMLGVMFLVGSVLCGYGAELER